MQNKCILKMLPKLSSFYLSLEYFLKCISLHMTKLNVAFLISNKDVFLLLYFKIYLYCFKSCIPDSKKKLFRKQHYHSHVDKTCINVFLTNERCPSINTVKLNTFRPFSVLFSSCQITIIFFFMPSLYLVCHSCHPFHQPLYRDITTQTILSQPTLLSYIRNCIIQRKHGTDNKCNKT